MAITLNKYSAVLPDYAVLLIWLVPLCLLIVWLVKEEKSKAFRRHLQETPIAYGVMAVVFLVALVFTTSIVKSKVFAAKANVAKVSSSKVPPVVSPSLSPQSDPASVIPQKLALRGSPNHPLARGEKPMLKAVPAAPVIIGGDVHQETKGDCSPATIGSNNTNNCNVPPKINASPQTQVPTGNPAVPWATRFMIQSTALTQLGDLRVTSDGPVLKMEMARINRDSVCNGSEYVEKLDERTAVFQVCSSEMMAPGHPVTITIYSLNPVRAVSGTFGANSITFQ